MFLRNPISSRTPARVPGTAALLCSLMLALQLCGPSVSVSKAATASDRAAFSLEPTIINPTAPAEGSLPYDIVVPDSLCRSVHGLQMELVEGYVSESLVTIDGKYAEEIRAIVESGQALTDAGTKLRSSILSIGQIDPTLGMVGLTASPTSAGAVKDSLLDITFWHDSPDAETRALVGFLRLAVNKIVGAGPAVYKMGGEVRAQAEGALTNAEDGELHEAAETVRMIGSSMEFMGKMGQMVLLASADFDTLLAGIRRDGGTSGRPDLNDAWSRASADVAEASEAALVIRGSAKAGEGTSRALNLLLHGAEHMGEVIEVLVAHQATEAAGRTIPWHIFGEGVHSIVDPKVYVLAENRRGITDESKERIKEGLAPVVHGDRLLAEWAVSVATDVVIGTAERMLAHYREEAGVGAATDAGARPELTEKAQTAFDEDFTIQSALLSLRGALGSLEEGKRWEAEGYCSENKAIIQYKNVWLHALSAGASAQQALSEVGLDD